jgi:hypothetical protein
MGRYYSGQIAGKFWFGVQSSNDASYFGIEHIEILRYHVCGCERKERDAAPGCSTDVALQDEVAGPETLAKVSQLYCTDCYSSLDEHKQSMIDEMDEDDDDIDYSQTWYLPQHEICYEFTSNHIEMVDSEIKALENAVGKYMSGYKIEDDGDEITYSYAVPELDELGIAMSRPQKDELSLIARLCLGKQISYCLHKHGRCSFYAEL